MLSAHFRTYSVSSAQPLHPSPKVLQLQGLPPPYPEYFVPGKQGRHCFLLAPLLSWVTCVQLLWSFSSRSNTPKGELPSSQALWLCSLVQSVMQGEPTSWAKKFA